MSAENPGATVLPRPRVDALLSRAWTHRVSVISAGAGFGKTTALTARFGGAGRVEFMPIRANDRDVAVLSSRIARAVGVGAVMAIPDSVAGVDDRVACIDWANVAGGLGAGGVLGVLVVAGWGGSLSVMMAARAWGWW